MKVRRLNELDKTTIIDSSNIIKLRHKRTRKYAVSLFKQYIIDRKETLNESLKTDKNKFIDDVISNFQTDCNEYISKTLATDILMSVFDFY